MAQEFKIVRVSEQPPREYEGQYGKVYYIKVMLEGHPKPVEVGKKKPDALKVGDMVYGDIKPSTYDSDGFKSANKFPAQSNDEVLLKLNAIQGDIKLLLSFVRQMQKTDSGEEIIDEDIDEGITLESLGGEEPVDLSEIPF